MADNDTARRYERAADAALKQLDWCITYLRGARKNEIAGALSRNRDAIRRRMQERPASRADPKR